MNAAPYLSRIAEALAEVGLDTVLIGNAAAALQGAPVTTLDFDFMFRDFSRNIAKLKALALGLSHQALALSQRAIRRANPDLPEWEIEHSSIPVPVGRQ